MNCPACRQPMVVLELDEIEIDHCISCGGIWLDAGELELLLEDSAEKDKLLSSFKVDKNTKRKSRRCPLCLKKMQEVLCGVDNEKKIIINECPQKDGFWFDRGELEEIIRIGSFDKSNKVLELLKDMFKKS
ncbi:MAG: zf-TFIIB domain-containing protein [Candidatus Ratteibacteria bacterium]|nr:zf-TFIIB domain-containing protein [Candidatus Ratteibacteria bacterium]